MIEFLKVKVMFKSGKEYIFYLNEDHVKEFQSAFRTRKGVFTLTGPYEIVMNGNSIVDNKSFNPVCDIDLNEIALIMVIVPNEKE